MICDTVSGNSRPAQLHPKPLTKRQGQNAIHRMYTVTSLPCSIMAIQRDLTRNSLLFILPLELGEVRFQRLHPRIDLLHQIRFRSP